MLGMEAVVGGGYVGRQAFYTDLSNRKTSPVHLCPSGCQEWSGAVHYAGRPRGPEEGCPERPRGAADPERPGHANDPAADAKQPSCPEGVSLCKCLVLFVCPEQLILFTGPCGGSLHDSSVWLQRKTCLFLHCYNYTFKK